MNPPLRIVFVLPDLPLSGAATRTAHLARDLVEGGDEVTVLVLLDRIACRLANNLAAAGVEVSTVASLARPSRPTWNRYTRPTVVHAAMPTAGLAGLMLAGRVGAPLVYSVTNCLHVDRPLRRPTPRDRLKAVLERHAIERADAVHAVSPGVASQVIRRHPRARTRVHTVVHPPTNPPGSGTDVLAPSSAAPRLLCLGRLLEHKRVEDAIEATALLRPTFPLVHLAVVGTGPRLAGIRSLVAARHLKGHVTLVGESSDPASYFAWANVLVHPSLYEGYPRVVAEARACGVPVVCAATAHTPTGESIHHARPFDADALRAAIIRAVHSPAAVRSRDRSGDDGRGLPEGMDLERSTGASPHRAAATEELRQIYRRLVWPEPTAAHR